MSWNDKKKLAGSKVKTFNLYFIFNLNLNVCVDVQWVNVIPFISHTVVLKCIYFYLKEQTAQIIIILYVSKSITKTRVKHV